MVTAGAERACFLCAAAIPATDEAYKTKVFRVDPDTQSIRDERFDVICKACQSSPRVILKSSDDANARAYRVRGAVVRGNCATCHLPVVVVAGHGRQHITCSSTCKQALYARRATPVPHPCLQCGKTIVGWKNQKYCGVPCLQKAYKIRRRAAAQAASEAGESA